MGNGKGVWSRSQWSVCNESFKTTNKMLDLLGGTMTLLIVLLIFGLPLGFFILYKNIVSLIYSGRRIQEEGEENGVDNEGGDILSPLPAIDVMHAPDASWIKPVVNFGFVLKLDEGSSSENNKLISITQLREHFSKCFLLEDGEEGCGRYEKLFSYIVIRGGYAFRATKKTINVEEHIFETTCESTDKEGNKVCIESFLVDWILSGYKIGKPCWEVNLISSLSEESHKSQYLAIKMHHANADGYSVLHILDKLTGNQSPYLVKDFKDGKFAQFRQFLQGPMYLGRIKGLPPHKNPFHVTPSEKHEWIISFTSLPLDKMKEIRRKFGVHMTSVVLTVMSGAMREFLVDEMKMEEIPEFTKIGNTFPWPRHPSRNDKAQNKDKLCNHWVAAILKVPLRDPDPVSRLKQIEADYLSYQKAGLDKFVKRALIPLTSIMPVSILKRAFEKDPGCGGGLTSLIGGDNYSLLGSSVEEIHPFLAIHDSNPFIGLSCFTFSHSGKMEVTFQAHPSVFISQECLDNFSTNLCGKEFSKLVSKLDEN